MEVVGYLTNYIKNIEVMDKCDICGKEMENLPYREKEGVKEGVYVEMCSKWCLEQFNSWEDSYEKNN